MKILLVDDEEVIHQAIGPFFARLGHNLRSATNGLEALRLVEEEVPDLVFSDIKMPDMGGLELLEKLKGRAPALPVVLITGFGSLDTAIGSLHQGAYDYLRKPLKLDDILTILKRVEKLNLQEQSLVRAPSMIASGTNPVTVDTLAAGIADILGPPAAEIRANLKTFQHIAGRSPETSPAGEWPDLIDTLMRNADRITGILDQVQMFTGPQSADAPALVDLVYCLDQALAQTTEERRGILLEKHCLQRSVQGIAPELIRLFANLLDNAARASGDQPGGKIAVEIKVRGAHWTTVVVEDNGPGIADEVSDRIFEPFFTTRTADEAAGLGLSICHSIATLHGGHIGFHSDPPKGSRFWVSLPSPANGASSP